MITDSLCSHLMQHSFDFLSFLQISESLCYGWMLKLPHNAKNLHSYLHSKHSDVRHPCLGKSIKILLIFSQIL